MGQPRRASPIPHIQTYIDLYSLKAETVGVRLCGLPDLNLGDTDSDGASECSVALAPDKQAMSCNRKPHVICMLQLMVCAMI